MMLSALSLSVAQYMGGPVPVAVLGATGTVGQKAVALLAENPRFDIIELVASEQHLGLTFGEACVWREHYRKMPEKIAHIKLSSVVNLKAKFIVSCIPTDVAIEVEPMLAAEGKIVFSNASAFRMSPNVPLLVPEINIGHLSLLSQQNTSGKIITNPNCAAIGIALALAPIMRLGDVEHVSIVTLQSVSGAGYPGVPSLDILCNIIPHIPGEAEKIAKETKKILGNATKPADFPITVQVYRVPVLYGHMATLHVAFKNKIDLKSAVDSYAAWNERHPELFVIHNIDGRPQSLLDLKYDDMRVHIGHLRLGDIPNVLGLVELTHNLVRGAAGAVIANMENYLKHNIMSI